MTNRELIFGKFKWYRKWKGGFWIKLNGVNDTTYWVNRKPYPYEIRWDEVLDAEMY